MSHNNHTFSYRDSQRCVERRAYSNRSHAEEGVLFNRQSSPDLLRKLRGGTSTDSSTANTFIVRMISRNLQISN